MVVILLLLLAGAVVNAALVGVALVRPYDMRFHASPSFDAVGHSDAWRRLAPTTWPELPQVRRLGRVFGITCDRLEYLDIESEPDRGYLVWIERYGWPLGAVYREGWMTNVEGSRPDASFESPYRVSASRLVVDTALHAAIVWAVAVAPFALRRRSRARRRLCPACAYPVGSSSVCTECGEQLRHERAPTPG